MSSWQMTHNPKNIRLTLGSLFFSHFFTANNLKLGPITITDWKLALCRFNDNDMVVFEVRFVVVILPVRSMSSKSFQIILKGIYGTGMLLCAIVCLCLCPDWMWNPKTSISLTEGARLMEVLEGRLSRVRGLANPGGEPPITLGFRFSRHALFIHLTLNPDLRTMIWWYGDTILDI